MHNAHQKSLVRHIFIMLHLNIFSQSFRIPLGAVGYYIVAKYTPMTPDGECGEPVYVLSERAVESKLNHILSGTFYWLLFLSLLDC